ncbi:MAG TPA: Crp/Fnr family transcriptional regulator [Cyclobacteriaceae bacterium]|jgi:CRP-like cAMP-binding protein|nr:Crp/Fnr family transcriptional regulator [Cyclobacteriaceae bacterium]
MLSPIDQLKKLCTAIYPFSDGEWEAFAMLWKAHQAKRKEQLTSPDEVERYLYFVVDGVQRVFYFDEQNREATLVFTYPPSFGGVLDSMMLGQSSRYYYETLTPSLFLRAPFTEIQKLSVEIPAIGTMIQKGLSGALSGVLERLVEVQCYSSEERFKKLLHRSPHILQLVPHKYLANYLGIDATNFSKLINKVKI